MKKPNRNDPCSCGSDKKFKKCCGKSSMGRSVSLLSNITPTTSEQGSRLGGLFGKNVQPVQSCSETPKRDIKVSK